VLADAGRPHLLADADKAQLDIHPLSGPQLEEIVTDFYTMPDTVKGSLRPVLATATGEMRGSRSHQHVRTLA
jgi:hypothetical protein